VDIVPAYKVLIPGTTQVQYYCIPDMNTETWIKSKPSNHATSIESRVRSFGGEFRKIIKLMKWWNHTHGDYLESYHIEALAVESLTGVFSEWAWDVCDLFDKMNNSISSCNLLLPCFSYQGSYADAYLRSSDRTEVSKRLLTAKNNAQSAWYAGNFRNPNPSDALAIECWRRVFGDKFPAYG
jgi:hypothetical protein